MPASTLEKLGQLLTLGFNGTVITTEFRKFLEDKNIGGLILFANNCQSLDQICELTEEIDSVETRLPITVSIDHEGGRVHRLPKPFSHFPSGYLIGEACKKVPGTEWGYEVGTAMARELRSVGIHFNYAPCLDIKTNPVNKVIGDRSFGNNPELVSVVGEQMIRGMQENGLAACGKHFPGHGDTAFDSHEVLPVLSHNSARIKSFECFPFVKAIEANVAALMSAHVVYKGIDKTAPATLSVKIMRDLLQAEMNYHGMVVSDDMEMNAISKEMPLEEGVLRALQAGCHSVIVGRNQVNFPVVWQRLEKAVETGELPEAVIDAAFARVMAFKENYLLAADPKPDRTWIGCEEHTELIRDIESLSS